MKQQNAIFQDCLDFIRTSILRLIVSSFSGLKTDAFMYLLWNESLSLENIGTLRFGNNEITKNFAKWVLACRNIQEGKSSLYTFQIRFYNSDIIDFVVQPYIIIPIIRYLNRVIKFYVSHCLVIKTVPDGHNWLFKRSCLYFRKALPGAY